MAPDFVPKAGVEYRNRSRRSRGRGDRTISFLPSEREKVPEPWKEEEEIKILLQPNNFFVLQHLKKREAFI